MSLNLLGLCIIIIIIIISVRITIIINESVFPGQEEQVDHFVYAEFTDNALKTA